MNRALLVPLLPLAVSLVAAAQSPAVKHSVTFTITYDFSQTRACSDKVKKDCVSQIVMYDISAGTKHRRKLATISVDPSTPAAPKDLTVTTEPLLFEPGKHLIAAIAVSPDKAESSPKACTTWIEIPPPPAPPAQ